MTASIAVAKGSTTGVHCLVAVSYHTIGHIYIWSCKGSLVPLEGKLHLQLREGMLEAVLSWNVILLLCVTLGDSLPR